MELTRKWWRNRRRHHRDGSKDDGFSLPTLDGDLDPLDTQEQEEMVRSFEKSHAQHSLLWRIVFAGFLFGYAAFLVYSAFQQLWAPWELRYHAYFMEDIQSWMVIAADLVAALACLLAVMRLVHSSRSYQQWMWYSYYTGLLLAVFWLYHMLRLPRFRWDIIWLPFGPLSGAAVCLYVDHLLEESLEDVKKLRSYMYNYKAL